MNNSCILTGCLKVECVEVSSSIGHVINKVLWLRHHHMNVCSAGGGMLARSRHDTQSGRDLCACVY